MKINKLIVCSDIHLRSDKPLCRNDQNWMLTQEIILNDLINSCNNYDSDLLIVGDLFHRASFDFEVMVLFLKCRDWFCPNCEHQYATRKYLFQHR